MIRVGSLYAMEEADNKKVDIKSGLTPRGQLDAIYAAVALFIRNGIRRTQKLKNRLHPYGVCGLDFKELEAQEKKYVKKISKNRYFLYFLHKS